MNGHRRFSIMIAVVLAVIAGVELTPVRQCQAQSDSVSIFLDQGYYGGGYAPWYSGYSPYSQQPYGYGAVPRYSSPAYSYPAYGTGYGFGAAGAFDSQMGPYMTSINGPMGNMFGPYTRRYYTPYGPMTYYGPYGFRGFDR